VRSELLCPNNGKMFPQGGGDRLGGCPYCNWWRIGLEFRSIKHPDGRMMETVPGYSVRVDKKKG